MSEVHHRYIEPLDVLFLRGNKLFGDAGSYGESLVPPWPSVAAGALRSAMLARDGVDLAAFAQGRVTHPLLGTPAAPGAFAVAGFTLARRLADGRVESLHPLPADLVALADEKGAAQRLQRLVPTAPAAGLASSAALPLWPVLPQGERGKPLGGVWLTQAGWAEHLAGRTPAVNHLLKTSDLWSLDERVGVGLDAERRQREAEEARMAQEQERRQVEEARQREEQARLEAIRQAEVEKARHEAEGQARLRAMQQQQEHERQLAALSQDKKKKQLTYMVAGIAALLVFGGVGGGLAWKASADKQAAIQAQQAKQIAENEAQLSKLMGDLKAQQDAMEAAKSELAGAKSEAERAAAQARLAAAQEQQKKTQANIAAVRGGGGGGKPAGGGTPRPACTCQAGDPLCACL